MTKLCHPSHLRKAHALCFELKTNQLMRLHFKHIKIKYIQK